MNKMKNQEAASFEKNVQARRAEIKRRYERHAKAGKSRPKGNRVLNIRMRELDRLLSHRYGLILADDDAGHDDLLIVAHHLYHRQFSHKLSFRQLLEGWVSRWCPWLTCERFESALAEVSANPLRWSASALGEKLGLTDYERTLLDIRTIRAIDCDQAQRDKRQKTRKKEAKAKKRRESGSLARELYETLSASRAEPWKQLGISRPTYYRWKRIGKLCRIGPETGAGTISIPIIMGDALVSCFARKFAARAFTREAAITAPSKRFASQMKVEGLSFGS